MTTFSHDPNPTISQLDDEFGDAYDQPKECSAEDNDDDAHIPYRYLKGWYLYNPSDPKKRLPLPEKSHYFPKMAVLRGWLQPPEEKSFSGVIQPILIELKNLSYYSMDRSPEYRGYWIRSRSASSSNPHPPFYWLQEPELLTPDTLICSDAMAQQEVHFSARLVLAIVTALCERAFCGPQSLSNVNKTVEQVLQEQPLLQTKTMPADDLHDFELRLLAKYRHGVAMHLAGYVPEKLEPGCSLFLQSLVQLQPGDNLITEHEIEHWCEAMERQCHQNWWGGPVDTTNAVDLDALTAAKTAAEDTSTMVHGDRDLDGLPTANPTAANSSTTVPGDRDLDVLPIANSTAAISSITVPVDRDQVLEDVLRKTTCLDTSGSASDIVLLKADSILNMEKPPSVTVWTKNEMDLCTKRQQNGVTGALHNKRPRGNSAAVGEDESDNLTMNFCGLHEMVGFDRSSVCGEGSSFFKLVTYFLLLSYRKYGKTLKYPRLASAISAWKRTEPEPMAL